jgi:integrase
MRRRLTTKAIENARPGLQRREIPDGGSGLYLILQPSGHRSWALRYRFNDTPIKLTLGSWPALALASARKAAADALHDLAQGNNPAGARAEAKIKAAAAKTDTVGAICQEYLRREGHKLRTVDQRESVLKRLVYPAMGDRPIASIKRSEIIRLLDKIEDKNGPRMADVALSVLRRIFNWHALRNDDFSSPIVRGMGRASAKERERSRILDDAELRAIWTASLADEVQPFGALVRFLLLSAARRSEAAGMRWDEVDAKGLWTLPASRSKTKSEVARPLSKAAQTILDTQPRICDHPFTLNGVTGAASFSWPKRKLDSASCVTGWRLHDLRRTARSLLSRAGINPDIAERCLGHAIPGIRGIYDRHNYIGEMRHAFEALAAEIERIVLPPEGSVVKGRFGRRA